jgi:hypothetical protein
MSMIMVFELKFFLKLLDAVPFPTCRIVAASTGPRTPTGVPSYAAYRPAKEFRLNFDVPGIFESNWRRVQVQVRSSGYITGDTKFDWRKKIISRE